MTLQDLLRLCNQKLGIERDKQKLSFIFINIVCFNTQIKKNSILSSYLSSVY